MKSHIFLQPQLPGQRFQIGPVPPVPDDVQPDPLLPYKRRGASYDDITVFQGNKSAEETDPDRRHIVVPASFNDILFKYAVLLNEE